MKALSDLAISLCCIAASWCTLIDSYIASINWLAFAIVVQLSDIRRK
jgi:hypothetical protein